MTKINKGLMTSNTDSWATPQDFFDQQNAAYGPFTLDVCASASNAKLPRYWNQQDDGLAKSWAGERCWMNPPYGRTIGRWCAKVTAGGGALVASHAVQRNQALN